VTDRIDAAVGSIEQQLRDLGTPERAASEKAYLKSSLEHFGNPMGNLRRIVRHEVKQLGPMDRVEVASLAHRMWTRGSWDMRISAVETLTFRVSTLAATDLALCERFLRESATWALVDPLSANVAGSIVARFPSQAQTGAVLDGWSIDENFWLRRSAMLSQLRIVRAADGDPARFFGYADQMMAEREFFIRKAIGWILREMSRRRPGEVYEWFLPRAHRASGVTVREVVKKLSPGQKSEVLRAWKPAG
jgi:3-methyladenine DNA glycosylase AlkD